MTHKILITLIILLSVFGVFFIGSKSVMGYDPNGISGVYCWSRNDCTYKMNGRCEPTGFCPDNQPGKNVYCRGTSGYCDLPCSNEIQECAYEDIPPACWISAVPSIIDSGQSSTIYWWSTNANSCSAWGSWYGDKNRPDGSETVWPSSVSAYGLTCTNDVGSVDCSAVVDVNYVPPPVPTLSCETSASPSSGNAPLTMTQYIWAEGTATGDIEYTWDCHNNDSWEHTFWVSTDNPESVDSACTYSSAGTYTYKAAVRRQGLTAYCTNSVTVAPAPVCTISTSVSPSGSGTANVNIPSYPCSDGNISSATATANFGYTFLGWDVDGNGTVDYPYPPASNNPLAISHATTWPNIVARFGSIPTVDLKARTTGSGSYSDGPININNNTAVDLQWTSTNATSCTASVGWSGAKATSGTQTTGNLTSNQTYTLTCTGPGGSASDTVLVNIGTLGVVLTANKISGTAPLTGATLTATVSGTTTGTINYTFYCNRADTGTNITSPNSHKLDGTNTNPYSAPSTTCDSIYATAGTYTAKVIAERGNSAAQSQLTITVNAPVNHAPTATNLAIDHSSFCSTPAPAYFFSWTYSDSDNDTESKFDFQVDNNSNFLSPGVDRSVINPPSTTNTQAVVLVTTQGLDNITYNTTYYWRVRVYDEHNLASSWVTGSSFTTPVHPYPEVNFTWGPSNRPFVNEKINLTDTSTCSGACSAYRWTMTGGTPSSAETKNTSTKYTTHSLRTIILQTTDSDACTCSKSQIIDVDYPLPTWKEIRPF